MIIMPANKPHALHAHQRFKMLLTMIHEWERCRLLKKNEWD
jgi:quercetin dioxygenase-like cupin family protein